MTEIDIDKEMVESIIGSLGNDSRWRYRAPDAYVPGQGYSTNPNYQGPIGPGAPFNQIQQPIPNSPPHGSAWNNSTPGFLNKGIKLRCCDTPHAWQQMIITDLRRNDQCILAKPAVGKTMPVICYWANLLGLNSSLDPTNQVVQQTLENLLFNTDRLPKVLWLVPIQALSENIMHEVKENFIEIMQQIINQEINQTPTNNDPYSKRYTTVTPIIRRFIERSRDQNTRRLILSTLDQKIDLINQLPQIIDPLSRKVAYENIVTLDKSFYDYLVFIIRQHVDDHFIGQKYETANSWDDKTIDGHPSKPFVLAIYESAKSVIGKMDNLNLMVFDEFQRLLLSGVEDKMHDERAEQIMKSLDVVLAHNNTRRARLVLLSGTTNIQSANQLTRFLNTAYHRNFATSGPVVIQGSNEGNIKVIPRDGLDDFNTQKQIIKSKLAEFGSGSGGVVFIIHSKEKIDQLLDQCSSGGSYDSTPNRSIGVGGNVSAFGNIDTSRYGSIPNNNAIKQHTSHILGPVSASDIINPLLRRAVASGLGKIYRKRDNAPTQEEHDNQIVQQLFLRGEIKVLLSTVSIQEGINIKAKCMYLSSIETMGNLMSLGNLCQLLNRVGRMPGYFQIFVAPKFVQYTEQALNSSPDDFANADMANLSTKQKLRETIGSTQHQLTSAWRRFIS